MRYALWMLALAVSLNLLTKNTLAVKDSNENVKIIKKNKVEKNHKQEGTIDSKDLWSDVSDNFEKIFGAVSKKETLDLKKALEIVRQGIIEKRSDQSIDVYGVFAELRKLFSESEWSTDEILQFIDDALEIKKKYPLILNFVIRSEYAKKAVKEGIDAEEVLQLASSEYIHLPSFVIKESVNDKQLNEVLSDLGSGVVWKDRMKYLYVSKKYSDKFVGVSGAGLKNSPRHIQHYFRLIEEIDKFYRNSYKHIVYMIAQDFYFDDLPKEKIMKIFSFSDKEWESLIKPKEVDNNH